MLRLLRSAVFGADLLGLFVWSIWFLLEHVFPYILLWILYVFAISIQWAAEVLLGDLLWVVMRTIDFFVELFGGGGAGWQHTMSIIQGFHDIQLPICQSFNSLGGIFSLVELSTVGRLCGKQNMALNFPFFNIAHHRSPDIPADQCLNFLEGFVCFVSLYIPYMLHLAITVFWYILLVYLAFKLFRLIVTGIVH